MDKPENQTNKDTLEIYSTGGLEPPRQPVPDPEKLGADPTPHEIPEKFQTAPASQSKISEVSFPKQKAEWDWFVPVLIIAVMLFIAFAIYMEHIKEKPQTEPVKIPPHPAKVEPEIIEVKVKDPKQTAEIRRLRTQVKKLSSRVHSLDKALKTELADGDLLKMNLAEYKRRADFNEVAKEAFRLFYTTPIRRGEKERFLCVTTGFDSKCYSRNDREIKEIPYRKLEPVRNRGLL